MHERDALWLSHSLFLAYTESHQVLAVTRFDMRGTRCYHVNDTMC